MVELGFCTSLEKMCVAWNLYTSLSLKKMDHWKQKYYFKVRIEYILL